jgi:hypothetical protein
MALNFRQQQAYNHRFQVWRRGFTENPTTGERVEGTYALVGSTHPGLYGYTQNDDDPSSVGKIKRRTALTEDKLECEVSIDIRSTDLVLDLSLDSSGSPTANHGQVHRVEGQPRKYPDQGLMELNYLTVQLMSVEANEIPAEVHP